MMQYPYSIAVSIVSIDEAFKWCEHQFGEAKFLPSWATFRHARWKYNSKARFYFKYEKDYVLFALRFL